MSDPLVAAVASVIEAMSSEPQKAARVIVGLVEANIRSSIVIEQRDKWSAKKRAERAAVNSLVQKMSQDVSRQKIESLLSSVSEGQVNKELSIPCPKTSQDISAHFAEFWKIYPRKKSKNDALRAWRKMAPTVGGEVALLALIKSALLWQMKSVDWTKEGGQFAPYPASYLNAGSWDDEPQSTAAPVRKSEYRLLSECE